MKKYKLFRVRDDSKKPDSAYDEAEDSTGVYLGKHGVSAKNRRGSTGDFPYTNNKGGPGMVDGILTVKYDHVREATAEAMKWGEVGNIKYKETEVQMTVKLAPQFYEPFAEALKSCAGEEFTFESRLSPPLFIADIGSKKAKKARKAEVNENEKIMGGDTMNSVNTDAEESKSVQRRKKSTITRPPEVDPEEIYKVELRKEKVKVQIELNKFFRKLCENNERAKANLLKRQGWQVHADRTPWYQRREMAYEKMRKYVFVILNSIS